MYLIIYFIITFYCNSCVKGEIVNIFYKKNKQISYILSRSLKARGQVEQWLANVESAMFDSVKNCLKKSLPELKRAPDFMTWVYTQHGQIVLTSAQIWFTAEVESVLNSSHATVPTKGLSEIEDNLKQKLDKLASVVLTESTFSKRNLIVSLMIILVHERDTITNLINSGIKGVDDFQWMR